MKDYYGILGIEKSATEDEIRSAYRKAIRRAHPDLGGSQEQATEVDEAYKVLSDPEKREQYDSGEMFMDPFERNVEEGMARCLDAGLELNGDPVASAIAYAKKILAGFQAELQKRRHLEKRTRLLVEGLQNPPERVAIIAAGKLAGATASVKEAEAAVRVLTEIIKRMEALDFKWNLSSQVTLKTISIEDALRGMGTWHG